MMDRMSLVPVVPDATPVPIPADGLAALRQELLASIEADDLDAVKRIFRSYRDQCKSLADLQLFVNLLPSGQKLFTKSIVLNRMWTFVLSDKSPLGASARSGLPDKIGGMAKEADAWQVIDRASFASGKPDGVLGALAGWSNHAREERALKRGNPSSNLPTKKRSRKDEDDDAYDDEDEEQEDNTASNAVNCMALAAELVINDEWRDARHDAHQSRITHAEIPGYLDSDPNEIEQSNWNALLNLAKKLIAGGEIENSVCDKWSELSFIKPQKGKFKDGMDLKATITRIMGIYNTIKFNHSKSGAHQSGDEAYSELKDAILTEEQQEDLDEANQAAYSEVRDKFCGGKGKDLVKFYIFVAIKSSQVDISEINVDLPSGGISTEQPPAEYASKKQSRKESTENKRIATMAAAMQAVVRSPHSNLLDQSAVERNKAMASAETAKKDELEARSRNTDLDTLSKVANCPEVAQDIKTKAVAGMASIVDVITKRYAQGK